MKANPLLFFAIAVLFIVTASLFKRPPQSKAQTGGERAASESVVALDQRTLAESLPWLFEADTGGAPQLTAEQINTYVEAHKHSAISLIAAWELSNDDRWLDQAATRHPDDPRVAVAMLMRGGTGSAEWAARLRQSDPDNALGPLHAAKTAFEAGQTAEAFAALGALGPQMRLDGYLRETQESRNAAYESAGFKGLAAEVPAMFAARVPASGLNHIGSALAAQMAAAQNQGDSRRAEELGALGMRAAALVSSQGERELLITQLIGYAMERKVFAQMHAFDLVPGSNQAVVQRLSEMDQRIARIKVLIANSAGILRQATESEARQYFRRVQVEGELKALEWLNAQHPQN